ncbi:hypothetical protein GCM10018779_31330 [Streptomyces griseocarneus]|nr:hypothetical protein GCM10018779_31330 [Streptomyces griseocarneus]
MDWDPRRLRTYEEFIRAVADTRDPQRRMNFAVGNVIKVHSSLRTRLSTNEPEPHLSGSSFRSAAQESAANTYSHASAPLRCHTPRRKDLENRRPGRPADLFSGYDQAERGETVAGAGKATRISTRAGCRPGHW